MSNVLADFDQLLDRERATLLAGALGDLTDIAREKSDILARMAAVQNSDGAGLELLRAKSVENQELYQSALAGLKAAARRIQAVRDTEHGFETYSRDGQAQRLTQHCAKRSLTF